MIFLFKKLKSSMHGVCVMWCKMLHVMVWLCDVACDVCDAVCVVSDGICDDVGVCDGVSV